MTFDPNDTTGTLVNLIRAGTTQKRLAAMIRTARETGREFDGTAVMEAALERWTLGGYERVIEMSWKPAPVDA